MISLPLRILVWMVSGWLLGNGIPGITYNADMNTFTFFDAVTLHLSQIELLLTGGGTATVALLWREFAKRTKGKL